MLFSMANLEGVLVGLVANGITSIVGHYWKRDSKEIQFEDNLRMEIENNVKIKEMMQDDQWTLLSIGSDSLWKFLNSPEVESIVRQIYACKLEPDHSHEEELKAISEEFYRLFSLHVTVPDEYLDSLTSSIMEILEDACEQVLKISIKNGELYAHEVKDMVRHQRVLDELATIRKAIEILRKNPDVQQILKFEEKYRQQVGHRHGVISPPLSGTRITKPINELYVSPSLSPLEKKSDKEIVFNISDFYSKIYRTVLLGTPGGGKSTFANKVCNDLSSFYSERLVAGRELTPILVILREYAVDKKEHNFSFLQYVQTRASSRYQISNVPEDSFEYLLLNGRVMVIFDGLDELLDTYDRQEMSQDIMSFCNNYPNVPVLVTSREVGYKQAPLDEKIFEAYRIAPFNDGQVYEYAQKWFDIDDELGEEEKKQKVDSFLSESEVALDIRSNPLMLSLMCNIYREENYIPRNLPALYQKCSELLFEKWDSSRGIRSKIPLSLERLRYAMMYIAYWMYDTVGVDGSVSERHLVQVATDFLAQKISDRDDAEEIAFQFVEFCKDRAWVFTNVGTTKDGEELYQFTHRTFLEYFTAYHLFRLYERSEDLALFLLPKIEKEEWDMVSRLAFKIKTMNSHDAEDKLLLEVIDKFYTSNKYEKFNLLSFATRCLEFIIPSHNIVRKISELCLGFLLDENTHKESPKEVFVQLLRDLFAAAEENRQEIMKCIESELRSRLINLGDNKETYLTIELILYMINSVDDELVKRKNFIKPIINEIFSDFKNEILTYAIRDIPSCIFLLYMGEVDFFDVVKVNGLKLLFLKGEIPFNFGAWLPIYFGLLETALTDPYQNISRLFTDNVPIDKNSLAELFLSLEPPYYNKSDDEFLPFHFFLRYLMPNNDTYLPDPTWEIDTNTMFVSWVLIAAETESSDSLLSAIKESNNPFFTYIRYAFIARYESVDPEAIQEEFNHCGFTEEQQAFIWKWIKMEYNLVQVYVEANSEYSSVDNL